MSSFASNMTSRLSVSTIDNEMRMYRDFPDLRAIPSRASLSPSGIGSEIRWNSSPLQPLRAAR